jgi:hypothetical protein
MRGAKALWVGLIHNFDSCHFASLFMEGQLTKVKMRKVIDASQGDLIRNKCPRSLLKAFLVWWCCIWWVADSWLRSHYPIRWVEELQNSPHLHAVLIGLEPVIRCLSSGRLWILVSSQLRHREKWKEWRTSLNFQSSVFYNHWIITVLLGIYLSGLLIFIDISGIFQSKHINKFIITFCTSLAFGRSRAGLRPIDVMPLTRPPRHGSNLILEHLGEVGWYLW